MIHLDFETYCDLNLRQVGADIYVRHPSCRVRLTAWAVDLEPVTQEVGPTPHGLLTLLRRHPDLQVAAFNARFERLVLKHVLDVDLPPERFHCVQVHAYCLGFFGGLKEVGEQVGLDQDSKKLASGTRLINKFCSPRKPTKKNPDTVWTAETAPEDWETFKLYNIQDVVAEREILARFRPYPMTATQQWEYAWDQNINDRGVPIDTTLVDACVKIYDEELARLKDEMRVLTGLENPDSQPQLLGWCRENGIAHMPNLTKQVVVETLDSLDPSSLAAEVLTLRQQTAKKSPTKWAAIQRAVNDDQRLRGLFQFYGASRTGRWAGRVFQPHNLPWPSILVEGLAEVLSRGDRDLVEALYDNVMEALVSGIRNGITAGEGKMLAVADLKSIESVLLGWVSGCTRLNRVFAEGRDAYRDFASVLFEKPENEVTGAERKFAKPPTLGCGYKLSGKGLVEYAASMGVEMTHDFANRAVDLFRSTYHEVVTLWDWLTDGCMAVTEHGLNGGVLQGYAVRIYRDPKFLFIELPSGRRLCYYEPLVVLNAWGRLSFSYMGKDQYTGRWERLTTHGGKLVENIVQAIARDVLMHGMRLATDRGLGLCMHVHDEGVAEDEADTIESTLQALIECLTTVPSWAPGLWLGAEGFTSKRYRKE